jgi:hypothetical protein
MNSSEATFNFIYQSPETGTSYFFRPHPYSYVPRVVATATGTTRLFLNSNAESIQSNIGTIELKTGITRLELTNGKNYGIGNVIFDYDTSTTKSIISALAGSTATITSTSSNTAFSGLIVKDITISGPSTWKVYNGTDNGNNFGWQFLTGAAPGTGRFLQFF